MKKIYIKPIVETIDFADELCIGVTGSMTMDQEGVMSKYGDNDLVFLDDEDAFEENPTDVMWNNICF